MTQFNFTFQPGMSVEQIIGFEAAGRIWSQFLGDDITVNIHIAMTQDLPQEVIGGAIPVYVDMGVDAVQNALNQDGTSSEDAIAASNLNVSIGENGVLEYSGLVGNSVHQSSDMTMTQANAKALGIATPNAAGLDGYVVLNSLAASKYSWNYDFGRTTSASSYSLDFLSVAIHELGHILGFTSGTDVINGDPNILGKATLLDLYRYSDRSLGGDAQELTVGQSAYFSIDGGQTNLAAFSEGIVAVQGGIEGYQASHWADNALGNSTSTAPTAPTAQGAPEKAFFVTDVLEQLFAIAPPAADEPAVSDINTLLAKPGTQTVLSEQTATIRLDETGGGGASLGVMDPTLAAGERSKISALDVLGMDVLGYDLTGASTNVNYGAVLAEAKVAIAQKLGVTVDNLNWYTDTGALTQDLWQEVLDAVMYERRRRTRSSGSSLSFHEHGLDPTVLNIVSDGAGESAEILAEAGYSWITTVEAVTPYRPLALRTTNLTVGDGANDLIIPTYDEYQTIDAGNGDNVVQLGDEGGDVTTGYGNDAIFSVGGKVVVDAGDGDNVLVLNRADTAEIKTGAGDDQIKLQGSSAFNISAGAGHNRLDLLSYGGGSVITGEGNDQIKFIGGNKSANAYVSTNTYVRTTGGNNAIDLTSDKGIILTGDGDDVIRLTSSSAATVNIQTTQTVTTTGGNNHITIQGTPYVPTAYSAFSPSRLSVTTGDGDDLIAADGATGTFDIGSGNDHLDLNLKGDTSIQGTDGDKTIRLNNQAAGDTEITIGDGNDRIELNRAGTVEINVGAGDNQLELTQVGTATITAGTGDDQIKLQGSSAFNISAGAGHNRLDLLSYGGGSVITGEGNDQIKFIGGNKSANAYVSTNTYVRTTGGNNAIDLTSDKGIILTGDGDDVIRLTSSSAATVNIQTTQTVTTTGGNNHITIQGTPYVPTAYSAFSPSRLSVTTGDGDDLIAADGATGTFDIGSGNDHLDLNLKGDTSIQGTDGDKTIRLNNQAAGDTEITIGDGDNQLELNQVGGAEINTGAGDDQIKLQGSSTFNISAGAGHNRLDLSAYGGGSVRTHDGNDQIKVNGYKESVAVSTFGGNNSIDLTSDKGWVLTGSGDDVIRLTSRSRSGSVITANAQTIQTVTTRGGNNHITIQGTQYASSSYYDSQYNSRISVTTGDGDDVIATDGALATIQTGGGNDVVILGDRQQAYFTNFGSSDYATIKDFSSTDRLQLHGAATDYRLTGDQLLNRWGDLIAEFTNGINFTLTGNQVYFVNDTTPDLDADSSIPSFDRQSPFAPIDEILFDLPAIEIASPKAPTIDLPALTLAPITVATPELSGLMAVDDILHQVQTHYTTDEAPAYSIVGGDDAQFFTIDSQTGDLRWKTIPDVATPLDADSDNKYDVIVQATLGAGNSERDVDTQRLTIINGEVTTTSTDHGSSNGNVTENGSTDSYDNGGSSNGTGPENNSLESSISSPPPPYLPASISGQVRNDGDGDGDLNDLDGGIAGVTLKLFEDKDRNSRRDGSAIAKTKTDANGFYSFTDLADGNYIVKQVDLEGFSSTGDVDGGWKGQIWSLTISGDNAFTGQDFLDTSSMGPWAEA